VSTVLVTGGSGFIAAHTIAQLLAAGHHVRTTVRQAAREPDVRAMLNGRLDRLSFFVADLRTDVGWSEAIAGCDYVLHIASPLPTSAPKHEDELIVPAREGTLRVRGAGGAARDAGVKRVVLTSSFAAIGYGHPPQQAPFTESSWSEIRGPVSAYVKSKTLAERAAWKFMAYESGALELAVVNPVAVLGPVLGQDFSASIQVVKRLLDGAVPGCPRLCFGVVDVRDVAELHIRCMTHPGARGERFLATAGDFLALLAIARVLKARVGAAARRVPARQLPDWLVRFGARFNPTVKQMLPELGKMKNGTHEKARRLLGWKPRSSEEAIVATAESLIQRGLVQR
jgi:nucleoside-diphosphate-sugar epimerase